VEQVWSPAVCPKKSLEAYFAEELNSLHNHHEPHTLNTHTIFSTNDPSVCICGSQKSTAERTRTTFTISGCNIWNRKLKLPLYLHTS
jgi:hypothetical protein